MFQTFDSKCQVGILHQSDHDKCDALQTQNICIAFVQRWVDVVQMLYNFFVLLDGYRGLLWGQTSVSFGRVRHLTRSCPLAGAAAANPRGLPAPLCHLLSSQRSRKTCLSCPSWASHILSPFIWSVHSKVLSIKKASRTPRGNVELFVYRRPEGNWNKIRELRLKSLSY